MDGADAAGEGVEGLRHRRMALAQVRGLTNPPLAFVPHALSVPEEVETFLLLFDRAAELYWTPPVLLILDTLSRFFGSGDENAARDMTVFLRAVDQLRKRHPKLHVMVVHHSGKDETKGMRGSSALKGAADTVIFCEKVNGLHNAVVEKQKDGEEGLAFPFALKPVDVGTDEDGSPISSCVVEPLSSTEPAAGPPLFGYSATAVTVLRDLARADAAILKNEVSYDLYRQRFIEAHDGNNDQTIRKAAMRAAEQLQKLNAIEFAGVSQPIVLKPKFWNLQVTT